MMLSSIHICWWYNDPSVSREGRSLFHQDHIEFKCLLTLVLLSSWYFFFSPSSIPALTFPPLHHSHIDFSTSWRHLERIKFKIQNHLLDLQWHNESFFFFLLTYPIRSSWGLKYWVGQKFCSGFSITFYRETQTNFLANPVDKPCEAIAGLSSI